jgi:hypothetical protein
MGRLMSKGARASRPWYIHYVADRLARPLQSGVGLYSPLGGDGEVVIVLCGFINGRRRRI